VLRTGSGAASASTRQAAPGEWRLNANGQRGGEKARLGDSAQPQSPTQAKERLEWATRRSLDAKRKEHPVKLQFLCRLQLYSLVGRRRFCELQRSCQWKYFWCSGSRGCRYLVEVLEWWVSEATRVDNIFIISIGLFMGLFLLLNGLLLAFWPGRFLRFYDFWNRGDYVGKTASWRKNVEKLEYRLLGAGALVVGIAHCCPN